MSKVKPLELDEKYHIIHYEKDIDFKKARKYAVYESWQFGCKIFNSIFANHVKYKDSPTFVRKMGKFLFFQTKLGKVGWFLLAVEYYLHFLFTSIIFVIKSKRFRYIPHALLYWLFIQLNLFRNFSKKLEVGMKMHKYGVFEFLGLDKYENALKSLDGLNSKNGLENFVKLVEKRLQIFKNH
ncbi:MAG: hypothetical protein N3A69_06440 [Leptospiraceae bacterium]|nr:hypothetical protein [Leptospiraceae bacterium]